jgi:hypothetical protein
MPQFVRGITKFPRPIVATCIRLLTGHAFTGEYTRRSPSTQAADRGYQMPQQPHHCRPTCTSNSSPLDSSVRLSHRRFDRNWCTPRPSLDTCQPPSRRRGASPASSRSPCYIKHRIRREVVSMYIKLPSDLSKRAPQSSPILDLSVLSVLLLSVPLLSQQPLVHVILKLPVHAISADPPRVSPCSPTYFIPPILSQRQQGLAC